MNNLIQQLKDNEKPFGLMSEELQKLTKKMNISGDLQEFSCNKRWEKHSKDYVLRESTTYRLRPDYEDEPEIVECEIELWKGELSYLSLKGVWTKISHAPNKPGFTGFKFADRTVMGSPVKYSVPGITSHGYYASYDDLKTKQALEHHAISVLFRRKKQE